MNWISRTIGCLLLVLTANFAQSQFISHCTFYTEDGMKFTVFLDGEKQNAEPQTRVRSINLTEPHFKLKIVFADSTQEPVIKKAFALQDNNGYPVDVTYSISKSKKGEYKIHFMDQRIYPGLIKPVKGATTNKSTTVKPGQKNAPCEGKTLGETEFSTAVKSIAELDLDDAKLVLAKQIISSNCVTTSQIKPILQQFTNEGTKVVLAKFAYEYTIDKGSYFKLNEEFKEEKNIEELYKAILKE
jgi:hypothetical protein